VRVKLFYSEAAEDGRRLERIALLRETVCGSGEWTNNADENDLDGSPGRGLYDPPPGAHDLSSYITLYCDGGLTLKFPTAIPSATPGYISLDWIAGKMRYQIDRKFKALDGSLASLELTEIGKEDAENFPPDYPHMRK